MADNIELDSGSGGATLAADDISSVWYQRVKLTASAADSTEELSKAEDTAHTTGDSGIMALAVRNDTLAALAGTDGDYAPLQVNASGALFIQEGSALDVSAATVTVDLGANNDVTIDNSSIVKAEDATHNSGDAGVMALAVRNDTLAALAGTDGDYAPLQVNASGALFIQEGSALDVSAATVNVASASALDVSAATVTVDLGSNNDVTIDGSSVVVTDDAAYTLGSGTGIMMMGFAGTQSVNANDAGAIAMETDGAIHIHDGGNTITVDGTVTANLSATDNAVLDSIQTAVELIDNAISGNEMQVDVVGALPAGDNNIGNVDIASSVALDVSAATVTVDLGANNDVTIDNSSIVQAEDAVQGSGDAGVMALAVRNDTLAALAGTDGDYAPLQVNASGALFVQEGAAMDVSAATVTVTDNGSFTLAANSGVDIGDVDVLSIAAGTNRIGGVMLEADAVATGTSTYYDNDLDETKIEVTDNPNVRIYSIHAINTTAAPLYLQLFDLDADNVTVGTTTPTNQYIIPGNADSDGAGFILNFGSAPKAYSTGFTVACTTDSEGSSAPGANACHVNIEYISAA